MIKYMLDTNTVIFTINNKPEQVRQKFKTCYDQISISAITLMELLYGVERSANPVKNQTILDGFVARLDVLPYEDRGAAHTGEIRAELARKGTPIGSYDAMIAGHARSQGLILVTNNTKEFNRVSGLRLEDWI
jgi:tRNA(fMet)-specific endonuclease VapC